MRQSLAALAALGLAAAVTAQSYQDLTTVRNRPPRFASALQLRAGVIGGFPDTDNVALGYDDELGLDGHLYYHSGRFTANEAVLDAYAGRDGAYLGIKENAASGKASRLELTGRYFAFQREGFYQDDTFVPTGQYDVDDYGGYLAFGRNAGDGLHVEAGPYIKWFGFDRNESTSSSYEIPDDFRVFGARTAVEHNTLQLDRNFGRPLAGFIATMVFEVEQNNSDRTFGTPLYMSSLPETLWRGIGHIEMYFPQSDLGVWAIRFDGRYSDREDRITNYDAQQPVGHIFVDGELGLRIDISALAITPFALGQWIKTLNEDGYSAGDEFFFGAGGRIDFDLGDSLSFYGEYSYLQNPARAPVSYDVDTLGEHQFFAGIEFRIGAVRN